MFTRKNAKTQDVPEEEGNSISSLEELSGQKEENRRSAMKEEKNSEI